MTHTKVIQSLPRLTTRTTLSSVFGQHLQAGVNSIKLAHTSRGESSGYREQSHPELFLFVFKIQTGASAALCCKIVQILVSLQLPILHIGYRLAAIYNCTGRKQDSLPFRCVNPTLRNQSYHLPSC